MDVFYGDTDATTRRFIVTVEALQLRGGYFSLGDVVTDTLLGEQTERLVTLRAIREGDFDLGSLFDGAAGAS